jgi:predicted RNase H-like nuclease (RuvC/YqgF family)
VRRFSHAAAVVGVATMALLLSACGSGSSTAADQFIAEAENPEERQALTEARDDIDKEMTESLEELDKEIERLRKENEELKARLAKKKSGA